MICGECQKYGEKARDCFTSVERIQMLTATVVLARSILAGRHDDKDLNVNSSITTKLLLSFPVEQRYVLIEQLRRSSGIEITLKNCPHGISVVQ